MGSWLGYLLALAGVPHLDLFDPDVVEEHNLNRMPYGPQYIAERKTTALAVKISLTRPEAIVQGYKAFTASQADLLYKREKPDWVIASTDTLASRREAYQWTLKYKIPYLEAAAEGEFGSIATSPAEWSTPQEANPGYAHVPVWVGPAISAAVMACSYVLHRHAPLEAARLGWAEGKMVLAQHGGEK